MLLNIRTTFCVLIYILSTCNICQGETTFDRNRTMIYLRPYVRYGHYDEFGTLSIDDVLNMVELIAEKFDSIVIEPLTPATLERSEALIPEAVAKFNNLHRNSSNQRPIQLHMEFYFSETSLETTHLLFDIVKDEADKTNAIHPGTVASLILSHFKGDCNSIEEAIQYASEQLTISNSSYKLGILLEVDNGVTGIMECDFVSNKTSPFFNSQFFLIWERLIQTENRTASQLFGDLQTSYSAVKTNLMKARAHISNDTVQYALLVAYESNDSILVMLWKLLNDWAIRANDMAIFFEAFDQRVHEGQDYYYGWWRLKENVSYSDPSQYQYEEKEEVIKNLEKVKPIEMTTILGTELVIAIAAAILTVVMLIVVSIVLIYKRRFSNALGNMLSHQEQKEFFEGKKVDVEITDNKAHLNIMNHLEYDKSLEVPLDQIQIDEQKVLGRGNFGIVCVAKIPMNGEETEVALKMTKGNYTVHALKGLLSEIKVLSYLGTHENITKLLGAYTADICKGRVYVFTELCEGGSLEKYLQSVQGAYGLKEKCAEANAPGCLIDEQLFHRLFQWSHEILNGMEYLAKMNVVHADLATRNILLTGLLHAKICDFGLARRLYNFENYKKQGSAQIPWRWTAPEALRGLIFNEKTDVWSYGVTLWEIFTLGEPPYSNISGGDELLLHLQKNQKPPRPHDISSKDIYANVMTKCWTLDANTRPTFRELQILLQNVEPKNLC